MTENKSKYAYLLIPIAYTTGIFILSPFLPAITKSWAAALSWHFYALLVRIILLFLTAVVAFTIFIRWFEMKKKISFLISMSLFIIIATYHLYRLGDSVNEFIHFPEYGGALVVWYLSLNKVSGNKARRLNAITVPLCLTCLTGVLDELYQGYLPQRTFDFWDISLNFLGAWLGVLIVQAFFQIHTKELKSEHIARRSSGVDERI